MKSSIYLLILICSVFELKCQVNLVANPSFEIDTCPGIWGGGYVYLADGWGILSNGSGGTPDLFNECYVPTNKEYWVPTNMANQGYQHPKTGNGYVGLLTLLNTTNSIRRREYIQGTLIQKLTLNKTYCVKANVNLYNPSKCSSGVGIYFDDGQVQATNNYCPIPYITPQIQNLYPLDDTLNWMLIEGSFTANGTEEYITIGNFYDSLTGIILSHPNSSSPGSYYYIDDISVIDISTPAYAGNDTLLLVSDTLYLGRPSEIGLDEACIWFLDGVPIDTAAGIWVVPDSTTTYVLQQTLCGNVQYDTVTVTVDTGTGVERIRDGEIKIFPNPSSGEVWYSVEENSVLDIEVFGIDGKRIYQENNVNGLKNNKINCNFDRGVYVVVIRLDGRIFREKVVVR